MRVFVDIDTPAALPGGPCFGRGNAYTVSVGADVHEIFYGYDYNGIKIDPFDANSTLISPEPSGLQGCVADTWVAPAAAASGGAGGGGAGPAAGGAIGGLIVLVLAILYLKDGKLPCCRDLKKEEGERKRKAMEAAKKAAAAPGGISVIGGGGGEAALSTVSPLSTTKASFAPSKF